MPSGSFQFFIHGTQKETVSNKLAKILNAELGAEPVRIKPQIVADKGRRDIDPVALSALILAIPATILATADVLDRMKKKQKTENTFEKIDQLLKDYPKASIHLESPDGKTIDIETGNSEKVLEAANNGS